MEVKVDSLVDDTDSEDETNNFSKQENFFETQFPNQVESCEQENRKLDKSLNEIEQIDNRIVWGDRQCSGNDFIDFYLYLLHLY